MTRLPDLNALGHARLTPEMEAHLRGLFIRHPRVIDLGSGTGQLAEWMRRAGALVQEVDKEKGEWFGQVEYPPGEFEYAMLSWPGNGGIDGLLKRSSGMVWLDRFPNLIVISKNTDGSMCGTPNLWRYLCTRELLHVERHRSNTLLCYGQALPAGQKPMSRTEEEHCGTADFGCWIYDQVSEANPQPVQKVMLWSEARDLFHGHLDVCKRCHDNPFNLCATGAKLLLGAAVAGADQPL